ncbi:unnamed protein product [Bursaphelenchus xylophilus]|uniref:(pine wood nematode) hypothetical protein n=1 Tax=Bursaphelenchus xylophilus TaxID=6326 RepID=A0A1I7S2F7_BURXY|nr:unnamed protein product [Bursaphelenchus xylophilus]CAG9114585.1 unnamed protein product [Bursaphelenchus xylophilus]
MESSASQTPKEVSPLRESTILRSSEESTPANTPEFTHDLKDADETNVPILRKVRAIPKRSRTLKREKLVEWALKFSSPNSENGEKRSNRRNKNRCDTCGQGGLIYCCDGCPLVFHANCHRPKIQVTDNKEPFYCRKCKFLMDYTEAADEYAYKQKDPERDESIPRFFHNLCFKMLTVREQPFTLPKSVTDQVVKLPKVWVGDTLPNSRKKRPDQDSECYICNKTVSFPNYNKCFFCPLVVHLDCQLEPQTARRIYAWRCPCHIENFVDNMLIHTESFVNRAKMYKKYASTNPNRDNNRVLLECAQKLAKEETEKRQILEAASILVGLKNSKSGTGKN